MREEFEKLDEIAEILKNKSISFCRKTNLYWSMDCNVSFINGAWYAYQEQQKKLDAIENYIFKYLNDSEYAGGLREILK